MCDTDLIDAYDLAENGRGGRRSGPACHAGGKAALIDAYDLAGNGRGGAGIRARLLGRHGRRTEA